MEAKVFEPVYDVVIVGAGIAGCPLAVSLAQGNKKVLLIERDLSEPDRIVGELLQPAGVSYLRSLGLGWTLEGIDAQRVEGYGIFYNGDTTGFTYPETTESMQDDEIPEDKNKKPSAKANDDKAGKENKARAPRKAEGRAFHHGRFIMKLREAAKREKNITLVQGTVLDLIEQDSAAKADVATGRVVGVTVRVGEDREYKAKAHVTVVCDGCHSRFRRRVQCPDPVRIDVGSHFVGAVLKDIVLPFDKRGNVFLIKPSPVLMYQIGSRETRVLVDVPGAKLPPREQLEEYLVKSVAPQLPEEVRGAYLKAVGEGNLKSMPNQYMAAREINTPGVFLIGDSNNMRHPLTGGGMTCAFADVVELSSRLNAIGDLSDLAAVEAVKPQVFEARKAKVSAINVLSLALYSIFSVPKAEFEQLRAACFYYLKAGGVFLAGPVGLLSGLSRSPNLLITHFFAVALYGTARVMTPVPTPWAMWTAVKMIGEAANIIVPLLVRDRITWLGSLGRLWYGPCTEPPQKKDD